jgi:hypothetical protein
MVSSRRHLFFTLFIIAILLGCTQDDEDPLGPDTDPRDKFLGTWSVNNESCSKRRYQVTITNDPSNSAQVLLSNFAFSQASQPDTALITGDNITLPQQYNSEKWLISGSGKYEDSKIQWSYTLIISADQQQCTATYTK